MEAARRAGIKAYHQTDSRRHGWSASDFSRLADSESVYRRRNFHGKLEFNSRRGLEKTTEVLVHLVQIFAEKAK